MGGLGWGGVSGGVSGFGQVGRGGVGWGGAVSVRPLTVLVNSMGWHS